jgi:bifunctional non-homologous end joining protein LigD
VLDGEIVCPGADGRSRFYDLMFRRDCPYFIAFDLLVLDGEDLGSLPLLTRKRRLRALMPRGESPVIYLDHVVGCGTELFPKICQQDCEGIVAKWARRRYYVDGVQTSWLKIRNADYSQMKPRTV